MKQKILLVTLDITLKGGIERVVCNMANNLILDHDVTILSFFKTNYTLNYSLHDNVKIHFINSDKNYSFSYSNYKILTTYLIIKNSNFFNTKDFKKIICMYPFLNILILLLTKIDRSSLIASEHSEFYSQGYILRFLRSITYKYVDKVVTLTNDGRKCFINNGINAIVIPNAVTDFYHPHQWHSKKKLLVLDKIYCLFAGRFEPVKQVEHVIQTAKLLQNNNVFFNMLGEGLLYEDIILKTKNMNITNIKFYGNVSNIESFYYKNQILLITSKTEAFPMVAVEAMSFGCIVIAYDNLVGPVEIIKDGINGFLVTANNIEAIVQKIFFLNNNRHILEKISHNSVNSAEKYKSEVINQKWKEIL